VIKLLSDQGKTNTLDGRIMITILLIQDFLVILFVPLMANISQITDISLISPILINSLILLLVGFIANKFIFPPLFRIASEAQELFLLSSLATAFAFIGISFILNIPISIGAFVGGLALSTLPYNLEIHAKIKALRDFLLTIFFVTLGIQLAFNFGNISPLLMIMLILIIFVLKPIIMFFVTLFSGYGSEIGIKTGIGLGQVSEFGFVLAAIGVSTIGSNGLPIITSELFSFLIAVIAISMIITPYLTTNSSKVALFFMKTRKKLPHSFLHDKFFNRKIRELQTLPSKKILKDHIIIIGGGTVGRGLAKALNRNHQVVVVDHDPEVVNQGNKDGLTYVYGTSEHEQLWEKIDLKDAKLLIITILDMKEALAIVEQTRLINRKLTIFTTTHYFEDTLNFYKVNVDFVAMPSIMGSNIFLENITAYLESGKLYKIQNFKTEYLEYLKRQVEEERKYRQKQ
ncbi:MAG: cation:proton antiporter, partial [Candidatus ainarchaeum sp.]|nr:cation:proton antiporter [Candidatus ainarchaeum sp.]